MNANDNNLAVSSRTGKPFRCDECGSLDNLVPRGLAFKNKCKACDTLRRKKLYLSRHETEKEIRRQYSRENRIKCNAYKRSSYKKNIAKERERCAKKDKSDHARARHALFRAVKSGFVIKPILCSECLEYTDDLEAHHHDYTKPFDVKWLCVKCHGKEHRKYY